MAMRLTVPRDFAIPETEALATALRAHFELEEPGWALMKAAGDLPQFFDLMGSWQLWVNALGVPASAFFAAFMVTLGQRTASALWDGIRDWMKKEDRNSLSNTAKALSASLAKAGSNARVTLGIEISPRQEALLTIDEQSPERIAFEIARLVMVAEKIAVAIEAEIAKSGHIAGPATISFTQDGFVKIEYTALSDFTRREILVKFPQ